MERFAQWDLKERSMEKEQITQKLKLVKEAVGLEKMVQSFFMNQDECEGKKHLSLQFSLLCYARADQSFS